MQNDFCCLLLYKGSHRPGGYNTKTGRASSVTQTLTLTSCPCP